MSTKKQVSCDKPVPCNQHEDIILSKIRHIERNIDELMERKKTQMRPPVPQCNPKVKQHKTEPSKYIRHPWFTLSHQCRYKKRYRKRRCPHQMPSLFSYSGNFCWTKP